MNKKLVLYLATAAAIRYFLILSDFFNIFSNRVEIATPLNSYKRLQEGIFLYNKGVNPYHGDMVHETPMILLWLSWISTNFPKILPLLYIFADLLTAICLRQMAIHFCRQKFDWQKTEKDKFAENTDELQFQSNDELDIPKSVLVAYLLNPFCIMNCCGLTTTVFSNLFLSIYFLFLSKKSLIPCLLFLALETTRNFYPFVLIAPVVLVFHKKSVGTGIKLVVIFALMCGAITWINFMIVGNWSFLNSTIGFIFFYRDLQPNIGLFWYFFTEMFEHFRTMFLITFQMNATVLYLIPLSFRLRKDPIMLGMILISLMAIFKSYPCLGDVGLYISLLPIWKKCWKFMAHNFIVFCFFLITILIMPTLWHLWIYAGSANANFYFGATLAFCTGQIFLVTDLLFAYAKTEFCLKNGQKIFVDGKEAKIILE